jgi:hypothetical protein
MLELDKSVNESEIQEIFLNQNDALIISEGRKILLCHCGTFSQDLISSLSSNSEELMTSAGDKKSVVKRAFSILLEGLQNIRLHGEYDELKRQLGFVVLSGNKEDYKIIMANIIDSKDVEKVEKYIDKINSCSKEKLKEMYLSVLANEFLSQKGGAGLGFITTRKKSGNPLNYNFYPLTNGRMLFKFEVILKR